MLFENYLLSSSTLSSRNNRAYSKKCAKKQVCLFVYFNEIIRLIIMKVKKKNRSRRCNINRPKSRHGLTNTKYKKCLSMMILICIKQHPTNIWSSIYEKVKEHRGWVEKNVLLIKHKRVRQKTKTLKRQKSTQTVLNQKISIAKRLSY